MNLIRYVPFILIILFSGCIKDDALVEEVIVSTEPPIMPPNGTAGSASIVFRASVHSVKLVEIEKFGFEWRLITTGPGSITPKPSIVFDTEMAPFSFEKDEIVNFNGSTLQYIAWVKILGQDRFIYGDTLTVQL